MLNSAWKNLEIYTMDKQDTILMKAGILIEDGIIRELGSGNEIEGLAAAKGIVCQDGKGKILFPGMINTHTHLYQELLKGRGTDKFLKDWWPKAMAPAGLKLRDRHVRAGALLGIAEALQSGVTTIADYMQIQPVEGLGLAQLQAVKDTGIRTVYGRGYRDSGKEIGAPDALFESLDKVICDVENLKKTFSQDDLIKIWLAPAAAWGLTLETLKETAVYSNSTDTPIMMHMFETDMDDMICSQRYQMSAIKYFESSGLLNTHLLAVHSVAVDDVILNAYKEHNIKVSYNPVSNMYLASGTAPVSGMLKQGIVVGLGTDGAGSNNDNDMVSALKIGALVQKAATQDPLAMTAYQMMKIATINGAECLNLDEKVGSIEVGKEADLFLFNPALSPKTYPCHDPVISLVYSGDCKAIEMVMVKGRVLYNRGEYQTMDYEKVISEAGKMADELSC